MRLVLCLLCLSISTAQAVSIDPASTFAKGQAALARGDLQEAEMDFRTVLLEPTSLPARANLGVVYMRRKDWARALEQFRRAERLGPGTQASN